MPGGASAGAEPGANPSREDWMFAESGNVVSTRRRLGAGILILGLSALPAGAQEHPNFSGLWDINAGRSDDAVQKINDYRKIPAVR